MNETLIKGNGEKQTKVEVNLEDPAQAAVYYMRRSRGITEQLPGMNRADKIDEILAAQADILMAFAVLNRRMSQRVRVAQAVPGIIKG